MYLDAKTDTYLEEVSSCNIFVVKGKTIRTPPLQVRRCWWLLCGWQPLCGWLAPAVWVGGGCGLLCMCGLHAYGHV